MPRSLIYSIVVFVAALIGLSLTKTSALQQASEFKFFLAGALIGLFAVSLYRLVEERILQSLPPARLLRGLKLFGIGFLTAILGWLVSAFMKLEYGLPIVVVGMAMGACGMAYHYYLLSTRSDA